MNARSEFVTPTNSGGGGVEETRRRFQIASPASSRPGARPILGSGTGGPDPGVGVGAGAGVGAGVASVPADAQAPIASSVERMRPLPPIRRASASFERSVLM